MDSTRATAWVLVGALSLMPLAGAGCEDLPGGGEEQGAVIGGVGGAAAGAAVAGEDNRLVGALVGGLLGAGGGYLLGGQIDDDEDIDEDEARRAIEEARQDPATVEDVEQADTADLNNDGYVTMDELIAMEEAGLGDEEIIDRLDATDQVFVLSDQQEQELRDAGVSWYVIRRMQQLNQEEREQLLDEQADDMDEDDVLSNPINEEGI